MSNILRRVCVCDALPGFHHASLDGCEAENIFVSTSQELAEMEICEHEFFDGVCQKCGKIDEKEYDMASGL